MPRAVKTCGVVGCSMKHYAKGFCKRHYTQVQRHGELTPHRERGVPKVCAAPNCFAGRGFMRVKGIYYCLKHARQIRAHGRLTPEREHAFGHADGCAVPGCDKVYRAKGLCTKHYAEMRWRTIKGYLAEARALAGWDPPAPAAPAIPYASASPDMALPVTNSAVCL